MDDIRNKFRTMHKPTAENPWLELEYTDASDLNKFVAFVNELDNVALLNEYRQPFLFRGQANSSWTLRPKIDRLLNGMPLEEALRRECEAFGYFRQRAHVFVPLLVPEQDNFPEWLGLMQHFGAPTRLLDWTTSFSIALYFAVTDEPLNAAGAVWLFPTEPVQKWMNKNYPDSELAQDRQEILKDLTKFIDFGMNKARPTLNRFVSERKSERVMAQRGVFTYSERLFSDHALLLGLALMEDSASGTHLPLCKIIISPQAKRFLRQHLSKLNISAVTLFPGIDGLGRAICETVRVEREVYEDMLKWQGRTTQA